MINQTRVWTKWVLIGAGIVLVCGVVTFVSKDKKNTVVETPTTAGEISSQNIQKYEIDPELVSKWNPFTFKVSYKSEYSNVSFAYSTYYPDDWRKGRNGFGNGAPEVTFQNSKECVSIYSRIDGPIRTDVGDITTILSKEAPSIANSEYKKHLISTQAIEVNGRKAIKKTYQLDENNQVTFEVLIIGGISSVNSQYTGTYSDVYTIASCPGTSEAIFDKIVSGFILKQPNI